MWKVYQSISSARKMKDCSVYLLEFSDKPMYVVQVQEGIFIDSKSEPSRPSQDTSIASSVLEEELEF